MSEPAFDPLTALRTLLGRGVRFVLIGGYAGALRGSPVITGDLDICYARDDDNLARLADALGSLDAHVRGAPRDVPFQLDARTLRVLRSRRDIACVLVNPLQALHPNASAPADSALVDSSRNAHFDRQAYTAWLQ